MNDFLRALESGLVAMAHLGGACINSYPLEWQWGHNSIMFEGYEL